MQNGNGDIETVECVEPHQGRKLVVTFGHLDNRPIAALFVGDADEPVLLPLDFVETWGVAVDPPRWERWRGLAVMLADALSTDDDRKRLLALAMFEDALEDEGSTDAR